MNAMREVLAASISATLIEYIGKAPLAECSMLNSAYTLWERGELVCKGYLRVLVVSIRYPISIRTIIGGNCSENVADSYRKKHVYPIFRPLQKLNAVLLH